MICEIRVKNNEFKYWKFNVILFTKALLLLLKKKKKKAWYLDVLCGLYIDQIATEISTFYAS